MHKYKISDEDQRYLRHNILNEELRHHGYYVSDEYLWDIVEKDLSYQRYLLSPEDHACPKSGTSNEDDPRRYTHFGNRHPDEHRYLRPNVFSEDRRRMDASVLSDEMRKAIEKRTSIQDSNKLDKKTQRRK